MVKKIISFTIASFAISFTLLTLSVVISYADTATHYQTTASKTTAVGTVAGGSTGGTTAASTFAQTIVDTLKNTPSCKKIPAGQYLAGFAQIDNTDVGCVPQFPNGSTTDLTYGIKQEGFQYLQCTNFARAVAHEIGHPFDKNGDAFTFASNPPTGYTFIKVGTGTPQPGDIAIWSDDGATPGHIAVIITVKGSEAITVAEGNGKGIGQVDTANYPLSSADYYGLMLAGWLHLQ